jgi:hypothetical protein
MLNEQIARPFVVGQIARISQLAAVVTAAAIAESDEDEPAVIREPDE